MDITALTFDDSTFDGCFRPLTTLFSANLT